MKPLASQTFTGSAIAGPAAKAQTALASSAKKKTFDLLILMMVLPMHTVRKIPGFLPSRTVTPNSDTTNLDAESTSYRKRI